MEHGLPLMLILVLVAGCSSVRAATPEMPLTSTFTPSPIPPTTPLASSPVLPTDTATPHPTPLPGKVVLPIDTLGKTIPWLFLDETARSLTNTLVDL